jgi:hypothetical protein
LDCGGKPDATPLSHTEGGLIVRSSSSARKRRQRSRSAGALLDASASFEPSIDYVVTDPESFRGKLILQLRDERIFFIRHALRAGFTIEEIFNFTKIDRWFLVQIKEIVDFEEDTWSGRRESNPRVQLGRLPFYH